MTDSLARPRYRNAWHVVRVVFHEKDLPNRSRLGNTVAGMGNFYRVRVGQRKTYAWSTDEWGWTGNRAGGVAGVPHQCRRVGRMGSCDESCGRERGMSSIAVAPWFQKLMFSLVIGMQQHVSASLGKTEVA